MVDSSARYNFTSVVDEFLALKSLGGPNGEILRDTIKSRASEILSRPDIRYMPAYKLLDMVAEMVNVAHDIAAEHQLRRNEAIALLQSHISDSSPLVSQFILEAALERARYEPMMLDAEGADALAYRNLTLSKRWQAMLAAHESHSSLPADWSNEVSATVMRAISNAAFAQYRVGPLLQLFAEMLQQARLLHLSAAPQSQLGDMIGERSPLWKRYALKAARYKEREKDLDPYDGKRLPNQSRVPNIPAPAKHSLH